MVNFLNITIEGDYIYAIAEDCDNGGTRKKVKVHKTKEEFYVEGGTADVSGNVVKAFWGLQRRLKKNKKLRTNETIAWY